MNRSAVEGSGKNENPNPSPNKQGESIKGEDFKAILCQQIVRPTGRAIQATQQYRKHTRREKSNKRRAK